MAQHLERASHIVVIVLLLTVRNCSHFLQQNAAIRYGAVEGVTINLKVLGIGNGVTVWRWDASMAIVSLMVSIRTHFRKTLAT